MRTIDYMFTIEVPDCNQDFHIIEEIKNSCNDKNIRVISANLFYKDIFLSILEGNDLVTSMEMLVGPNDKNELVEKLATEFSKLKNEKQLLIIDPYFFDGGIETIDLFIKIFEKSNLNPFFLKIISRENLGNKNKSKIEENIRIFKDKIFHQFGIDVEIQKTDEFHDRFWLGIESEIGILMGTSLNGLAKKICLVHEIEKQDVKEILSTCSNLELI